MIKKILNIFFSFFFKKDIFSSHYFINGFMGYKWVARSFLYRNILNLAPTHEFPVGNNTYVSDFKNIDFSYDDLNNFQSPGCYFQCFRGTINIGKGTYIGPNVGLITSNHDPDKLSGHLEAKNITIGKNCWIGMNVMVLPGVVLADNITVGAGAVVTKSFLSPGISIAGNPAKIISN
jgi:acetyltransferase-like isoleucine patch superfamily enzyme